MIARQSSSGVEQSLSLRLCMRGVVTFLALVISACSDKAGVSQLDDALDLSWNMVAGDGQVSDSDGRPLPRVRV